MNIIGQRDLKPCPFCGHEPMSGEVRPATRKSPPLFTGQDIEDIIGVRRSDFNLILADASYRRLADLIEPEPELPLNVCPFCGTGVMGEGRDAVHG